MSSLVYTIDELRQILTPIAGKYDIQAVYVFGSYARNEATENSDVDVLIQRRSSNPTSRRLAAVPFSAIYRKA